MKTGTIKSEAELRENWKDCFILGLPKYKSLEKLLEGFNRGMKVVYNERVKILKTRGNYHKAYPGVDLDDPKLYSGKSYDEAMKSQS